MALNFVDEANNIIEVQPSQKNRANKTCQSNSVKVLALPHRTQIMLLNYLIYSLFNKYS